MSRVSGGMFGGNCGRLMWKYSNIFSDRTRLLKSGGSHHVSSGQRSGNLIQALLSFSFTTKIPCHLPTCSRMRSHAYGISCQQTQCIVHTRTMSMYSQVLFTRYCVALLCAVCQRFVFLPMLLPFLYCWRHQFELSLHSCVLHAGIDSFVNTAWRYHSHEYTRIAL